MGGFTAAVAPGSDVLGRDTAGRVWLIAALAALLVSATLGFRRRGSNESERFHDRDAWVPGVVIFAAFSILYIGGPFTIEWDYPFLDDDYIAYRYLDKIIVKGRTQPVAMYEVTGFRADLEQETQDCLDYFQQGIDKYLLQDWDGAKEMFEKSKELEPYKAGITPGVKDNPSTIFAERCLAMKWKPPGDDWDGVFVMTSK